jgi:Zn-dependent metalloprotease
MKTKTIIILFAYIVLTNPIFAQKLPTAKQINEHHLLNSKYQQQIKIKWNKTNGSPEIIHFKRPVAYDQNQKKSATRFLVEIKNLLSFRSNQDTLILIKCKERKGNKYFRYQQYFNGVRVKGGEYVLTVLPRGEIITALGSFNKGIKLDIKPTISVNQAIQIALNNSPNGKVLKKIPISSELIIYPDKGKYYLA